MTDTFFKTPIRATIRAGEDQVIRLTGFKPAETAAGVVETDLCGGPVRGAPLSWVDWSSLQCQAKGKGMTYDLVPRFIGLKADGLIAINVPKDVSNQMQADGVEELDADLFAVSPANLRKRLARIRLCVSFSTTAITAPTSN